jgi:hypothetical protein
VGQGVKHVSFRLSRIEAWLSIKRHFFARGWSDYACRDRNGRDMTPEEIEQRLEILRVEHRDLDCAIAALAEAPMPDQLQLARLKKRKLRLRDEIAMLEDHLVPDIIA